MIGATRARRRSAEPKPAVLLISVATSPILAALLAGEGAWLTYQFTPPDNARGGRRGIFRWIPIRAAQQIERQRRRRGGGMRITSPNESCQVAWESAAPFLEPTVAPIAGCRPQEPIRDARRRLGLGTEESLALVYGFPHDEKDLEVVDRAFAGLEDWRLVVAGQMAAAYRKLPAFPRVGPAPVLLPGHLDDATVDLLHSAADLAVLSFKRDYDRESGTLLDAIGVGDFRWCVRENLHLRRRCAPTGSEKYSNPAMPRRSCVPCTHRRSTSIPRVCNAQETTCPLMQPRPDTWICSVNCCDER